MTSSLHDLAGDVDSGVDEHGRLVLQGVRWNDAVNLPGLARGQ